MAGVSRRYYKAMGVIAVAAAIAAVVPQIIPRPATAASLDEIKKRGSLIVATEDDFRPFEFVQDGKPTGFDNELLAMLRNTTPFQINQEIIPWTGLLAGVTTGKYDVALTAVLITKERSLSLDFKHALVTDASVTVAVPAA